MGPPKNVEWDEELLARALGKLSELSPQEAWQIVVNWIMDVYRQAQLYNEIAQTYQQKIQESDAKVEAIQNDLRNLQQMVNEGRSFRI